MDTEILNIIQNNSAAGLLVVIILMGWRVAKFFVPLIENYLRHAIKNQTVLIEISQDLMELQRVCNDRLSMIELQLTILKEKLNEKSLQ